MKRVTGIGGPFIRSKDPAALAAWYEQHLGAPFQGNTYAIWPFAGAGEAPQPGFNILSFFKEDAAYFAPSEKSVMLNFMVADLFALLEVLRGEGVTVVGEPMVEEYGKFGWIMDPEGNKIELWEPPA